MQVARVLLCLTFLVPSDAQGHTGHASDLDILKERPAHGRHMLASTSPEQQQQKKPRVKRYRRKPTPKHKRREKTDLYTESHSKDGVLDQWTRTHSVSRLGPRRSHLYNRSQTKRRRQASVAKRAQARRNSSRLISQKRRIRKQQQSDQERLSRPTRQQKRLSRPRKASQGTRKRKSPASQQKASARRKASKARQPQKRQAQKHRSSREASQAQKKAAARAKRNKKVRAFRWKGKGTGGFKWNGARRARPHRIPWKGQVVYDEGDVVCVAQSEQEQMKTETQSAEIHAQAGMPPLATCYWLGVHWAVSLHNWLGGLRAWDWQQCCEHATML